MQHCAVADPAPQVRFPGNGQRDALQGGIDVTATHLDTAGAEQTDGRQQCCLRLHHVLLGLLDFRCRNGEVRIVQHGLCDQRIELWVVKCCQPVVLCRLRGNLSGFPRVRCGQSSQDGRLCLNFFARRRRFGGAGHRAKPQDADQCPTERPGCPCRSRIILAFRPPGTHASSLNAASGSANPAWR